MSSHHEATEVMLAPSYKRINEMRGRFPGCIVVCNCGLIIPVFAQFQMQSCTIGPSARRAYVPNALKTRKTEMIFHVNPKILDHYLWCVQTG
jgi:hypothetical protein